MTLRILLDINSLAHAAHRGTILKAGDQETQAIFGCLKTLRTLKIRNPDATILTLWDGASWRKKVSTVYKQNRTDTAKKVEERNRYKTQTPFIRKAFRLLGMPQLFAINLEADDLAAQMTRQFVSQGDSVHLITGDEDWLQLVGPKVTWEDHRDEAKKVNAASFQAWTQVANQKQFVQLKAMQGDTSDNLPGIGGVGEVNALLLIKTWGSVEAFLADPDPSVRYFEAMPDKKTFPKCFKDFHTNASGQHEKFAHNFIMMDLLGDHVPKAEQMKLDKGSFDPAGFKSLCHELSFLSITREGHFEQFIEPFKKAA